MGDRQSKEKRNQLVEKLTYLIKIDDEYAQFRTDLINRMLDHLFEMKSPVTVDQWVASMYRNKVLRLVIFQPWCTDKMINDFFDIAMADQLPQNENEGLITLF